MERWQMGQEGKRTGEMELTLDLGVWGLVENYRSADGKGEYNS